MKTQSVFLLRCLIGVTPVILNPGAAAAPLTWFRGPHLIEPTSGAATTADGGFGTLLIGGAASGFFPFPTALVATNNSWTVLPGVEGLNIAPGVAGSGDPILVYGGSNGSNSTSAVIQYSPSGDTVSAVPSMNTARAYLGYASDQGGTAYAIGGLDENGAALASAETLNGDTPTAWSFIASLPMALYNFPAVFDGTNRIYVFGGDTASSTETNSVFYYSANANTWTPAASMPIAVAGSGAARGVDGKFYVVGGVSGGVTLNVVQIYDPAANSWAITTPLPQNLSAMAMGVDSLGRLIVMGGADTNGLAVTNVWRSQQLGIPDSAPAFTQYPATTGGYQIPYVSTIAATGAPPPYYLLMSGPSGMAVDYYGGNVTWTPQGSDIGSNNPVTIRATNYAGYVDWSFYITVAPPPPAVPTNLSVVSVSDTTVTLSWAPENPFVGAVTYSIYSVTSAGKGGVIHTLLGTSSINSVTLTGLQHAHSYALVVKATVGSSSTGYSQEVVATTTGPQPPTNVRLTGLTSTTLSLAWDPSPGTNVNPNFSPIVSYSIGQYSGGFIPKVNGITNTFGTVTGLTPGSGAFWAVEGYDAQGFGALNTFYILGINNPVPVAARTSGGQALPDGNFQFTVQEGGSIVQTVLIQANTDLTNPNGWVQIGSVFPSTNSFTFTDTNAALYPMQFYRVLAP